MIDGNSILIQLSYPLVAYISNDTLLDWADQQDILTIEEIHLNNDNTLIVTPHFSDCVPNEVESKIEASLNAFIYRLQLPNSTWEIKH
ncbi:MAG: hypothetical protein ACXW2E_00675 [Nitrososphaeraceae archaeon]